MTVHISPYGPSTQEWMRTVAQQLNNPSWQSLIVTPEVGTSINSVGLSITQTYSGTISGWNGNTISVQDSADVGANFSVPLYIQQNFGGSLATGGRSGLWIDVKNTAATSASNPNRNYVGITAQGWATTTDGGTGLTAATAKGEFFGGGFVGIAQSGATNLLNVTAAEFNSSVQTGASVALKSIVQLSGQPNDAVGGSAIDTMLWVYDQGGASGHNDGILFDASTAFGNQWPIKSTGSLFRTTGGSALSGVDISATSFSSAAFKSTGFVVDGGGGVTLTPPASATPAANGQMTFQLTSNTQLTIKVKGSDGVVRSANLTLA